MGLIKSCKTANEMANVHELGSFVWICSKCKTLPGKPMNTVADNEEVTNCPPLWVSKFSEDITSKLNSLDEKVNTNIDVLANDLAAMKSNVSDEINRFHNLNVPATTDFNSPLRKRPKALPEGQNIEEFPAIPPLQNKTSAVLKLENHDAETNISLFKKMCNIKRKSGSDMPDFVKSKKSGDNCMNIMFKSYKDAVNAKKLFEEKIDTLKLCDPVYKAMKKLDVVGLDFSITKEEALDALIHENPGLGLSQSKVNSLSAVVETNPDLFITVIDVKKCNNSSAYRVLFRATSSFIDFLGKKNIVLMHTVTHKFVHSISKQCYRCFQLGHFAANCTQTAVCGKCSSNSHTANECNSSVLKCINCTRNNIADNAHSAFSHTCPYLANQ